MEQNGRGGDNGSRVTGRTLERRIRHSKLDRHLRRVLVRRGEDRRLLFATLGNGAVARALVADRRFCRDTPLGAMLHPQRLSFRELRTRTGLHVVLEAQDRISAHLDRRPPAAGRGPDGRCLYTRSRTVRHIWHDVLLSLVDPPAARLAIPDAWVPSRGILPEARPSRPRRIGSSPPRTPGHFVPTGLSDGGRGPPGSLSGDELPTVPRRPADAFPGGGGVGPDRDLRIVREHPRTSRLATH